MDNDQFSKALDQITRQSETSSEPSSPPCSDTEHDMNMVKLWVVMSETYGYKWTKPMGEEPNQTWVSKLRDISLEQWKRGLNMLSNSVEEWPPSAPEFLRWCTAQKTKEQLRAYAEQEADRLLAKKRGNYNPNVTPPSYEQAERERSRLARQIFAMEQENGDREARGLPLLTDPERIYLDEGYR